MQQKHTNKGQGQMKTQTQFVDKKITIIWTELFNNTNPFFSNGKFAQVGFTWQVENQMTDIEILEKIYRDTNLYSGIIWEMIEEILPANRPHTALSVGDLLVIDGTTYRCEDFGWKELGA
jgi:hypothetical protein